MKVNGGSWERIYSGDASTFATEDGALVQLGTRLGPLDADLEGSLDEVQVSEGRRSDDWVQAQYQSQANLGFVTVGAEDTCD